MVSMKKTALAAAVLMTVGTGVAEAAPVVNFAFTGTFAMYTPTGAYWGGDPSVTGTMSMDMTTGGGNAAISPSTTFSGYMWTAGSIQMQASGPGTVHAHMLFNWNGNFNIPVEVDFSMTGGPSTFTITTLASDARGGTLGVLGIPMASGPFPGWNATFGGTATVTGMDESATIPSPDIIAHHVPVPAAVWLFGSGLLGLVGVARRKKAA